MCSSDLAVLKRTRALYIRQYSSYDRILYALRRYLYSDSSSSDSVGGGYIRLVLSSYELLEIELK